MLGMGYAIIRTILILAQMTVTGGPVTIQGGPVTISFNGVGPGPICVITSPPYPNGQVGLSYVGNVTVSAGCVKPVTFAIAPTTVLNSGLLFSTSTGSLSGIPTGNAGSPYVFTLTATDSSIVPQTPSQVENVTISPAGATGPPNYGGSVRNANAIIQLPASLPNWGGSTGTNIIQTPSDFNNPIVRCTDATTGPSGFQVTPSGANQDQVWSSDSRFLLVTLTNNGQYGVVAFNPSTQQCNTTRVPGFTVTGANTFTSTNPKVLYQVLWPNLIKWTFTDGVTTPTSSNIYNFNSSCPGMSLTGSNFTYGAIHIDSTDTTIAFSIGNGAQDSKHIVVGYNFNTNQCSWYDTTAGTINGNWGSTGSASDTSFYTVHDAYYGRGGTMAIVMATNGCISGSCTLSSANVYFWSPSTTTVLRCTGNCKGGHNVPGFLQFINFYPQFPRLLITNMTNNANSNWAGPYPNPCCSQVGEAHLSWNNGASNDQSCIFWTSSTTPNAPATFTSPFVNEIGCQQWDGTFRAFAHTYVTGTNNNFYDVDAIGSVSQDGKWFAWTSDDLNSFGLVGINPRNDVLIVKAQ